ncbi:hypothetical protein MGAST_03675 [Mycobacterium gastri 'Wayne']|uniref:AB hydrolase-1 domain-containing protein n=1 Tax=Mycobacterium gastri TaxID=1777 RepID=A0A1X1VWC5_MYCGS|nr:hypothetical protein MGAST_03675 [Mycobacterium gastri 'Wayne']ORV73353.1 hypothetical protein AWC07_02305 [Mycobacterium gastri]
MSDKPRPHRYSLLEQADLVQGAVARSTTGPVVVLAHDMGTSVTTELLARDLDSFDLRRAVLSNGSVILERASLRPIQKCCVARWGRSRPDWSLAAASGAVWHVVFRRSPIRGRMPGQLCHCWWTQPRKMLSAVARSGPADVARFW